ncbi:hypothetical protein [Aeromonas veronii]|uniref:hypothetical protein n=1 Tax=Aeromonas veronii TaxID=654 RepID=UPI0022457217|nr:hypothetical protein [Aeromonas veronii]MCX0437093.1 hypothetical protein [Aeromonas veronii]
MKISQEARSRGDVLQYAVDDIWSVATLTVDAGIPADLTSGDAIDPVTGAKLTSSATACRIVADPCKSGSKHVIVFDKLVHLIKSQIAGANAAGTTKALELLSNNQFIRLV